MPAHLPTPQTTTCWYTEIRHNVNHDKNQPYVTYDGDGPHTR
jgi:hypothetical protein